jgi:hypothetical protein
MMKEREKDEHPISNKERPMMKGREKDEHPPWAFIF